ncbi:MAG: molybdate ABC transporter permease subunit [Rudaea sp.]|uniref:molybdate ABC transporter permease subunit n=1 Tax=unclassified Rudaea TaxID=2627037 RepID=UPI0010F5B1F6|nr:MULTISPECIES: molybdate ABC transporter permease subunit [unclassified Rudaea]MBN8887403.1 molybdate ABC transporter permease subunit [Rudaea sp.]
MEFLSPLWLTLKVAALATALALILGVAAARALGRRDGIVRDAAESILTLPLVLPPTVLGYYLLVVLGRNGAIGGWLHATFGISLIFTWQGAVIAAAIAAFPLILRAARAAFRDVDPQLERAARTLGANATAVFFRVSLPLAWRGIAAGALLAFARAMGEFGATLMVAGSLPGRTQTLSIAIYNAVMAGDDAGAQTLVLVSLIVAVVALVLAAQILQRTHRGGDDGA